MLGLKKVIFLVQVFEVRFGDTKELGQIFDLGKKWGFFVGKLLFQSGYLCLEGRNLGLFVLEKGLVLLFQLEDVVLMGILDFSDISL